MFLALLGLLPLIEVVSAQSCDYNATANYTVNATCMTCAVPPGSAVSCGWCTNSSSCIDVVPVGGGNYGGNCSQGLIVATTVCPGYISPSPSTNTSTGVCGTKGTCNICNDQDVTAATCGWCNSTQSCLPVTKLPSSAGTNKYSAACGQGLSVDAASCPAPPTPAPEEVGTFDKLKDTLGKVPYWAWIILGVGLLLVIILIVILCKKCNKDKAGKNKGKSKDGKDGKDKKGGKSDDSDETRAKKARLAAMQAVVSAKPVAKAPPKTANPNAVPSMDEFTNALLLSGPPKPPPKSAPEEVPMDNLVAPANASDLAALMVIDQGTADSMHAAAPVAVDDIDLLLGLKADAKVDFL